MLRISAVFVFCFSLVFAQNLTPDNEDYTTGGVLDDFLTFLELGSGLSNLVPNSTVPIHCPGYSDCTINPNGTVLWDVRAELYRRYLMQSTDDESIQRTMTLDGCLKYNPTDLASYQSCMSNVRISMRVEFMSYASDFRKLIDADCSLVQENCINASS